MRVKYVKHNNSCVIMLCYSKTKLSGDRIKDIPLQFPGIFHKTNKETLDMFNV